MTGTTDLPLPTGVTLVDGQGGLPAVLVETDQCSALIYLHGAHVADWTPRDQEPVLWMSARSNYSSGTPLRGGVPICFPWFGPGRGGDRSPAHGFARVAPWRLVGAREVLGEEAGGVRLAFELTGRDVAGLPGADGFADDFTLRYVVTCGRVLTLALTTQAGATALEIEEALHTYLAVGDIGEVTVEGLDAADYVDKAPGGRAENTQHGDVTFGGETDRVYFSTESATVVDRGLGRRIRIDKEGSACTVVWNPWVAKSSAMADFGDQEWPGMVCVETANALSAWVAVPPGDSHTMIARFVVSDLLA
jgi:glucose-6-phosphate 1-epimerase